MTDQTLPPTSLTIYEAESGAIRLTSDGENQTIWATQSDIAALFDCTEENVTQHIKAVFTEGGLDPDRTTKKNLVVRNEGSRKVSRNILHYNLDVILSVGYRVNSKQAARFRQWATQTLHQFVTTGFVLDEARLVENPDALKQLATALRKLRLEEKSVYAIVRQVFRDSASDYDKDSPAAKQFFMIAQDKFHYAATGKTASQIVRERADGRKPNMGLTTMKGSEPSAEDVTIGKNYLADDELQILENISQQFLLFAESKAFRGQTMTMEELSFKLNTLLAVNDYAILYEYPKTAYRKQVDTFARKQLAEYRARIKSGSRRPAIGPSKVF